MTYILVLLSFDIYFPLFQNSLYLSLASSDSPGGCGINGDKDSLTPSVIELSQENIDLRRQVRIPLFLSALLFCCLCEVLTHFNQAATLIKNRF